MKNDNRIPRRDWLIATSASLAATAFPASALSTVAFGTSAEPQTGDQSGRERRMQWWHEAKFGMFSHRGLHSALRRHEWVMENEGIPVAEYEKLAQQFKPNPFPAREWAKLAKATGQKYMVMTTKHHEGFCPFQTN